MQKRWEKVLGSLDEHGVEALLVVKHETVTKENARYISGFTGSSAYIVIHKDRRVLLTDDRYTEQAAEQCPEFEVVRHGKPFTEKLATIISELGIKCLGYETAGITVAMLDTVSEALPNVEMKATKGIIEGLRAVKDDQEIALLSHACELADRGYTHLLKLAKPGLTEKQLAYSLECFLRESGAEGLAFDMILVSEARTSHQHGSPSDRPIESGDFVLVDFGARYGGYRSDLTRTFVVGSADDKQVEVYETVKRAQETAVSMLADGVKTAEVCSASYQIICDAGYADFTGRGVGHGVGLEIHEEPFVSPEGAPTLQAGHVITVEPGIYIPDWGGVRIEDTVLITPTGYRLLTHSSKELHIV